MRKLVFLLLLTVAGCGDKTPGNKVEADAVAAQKPTIYGEFTTKGPSPEEKFAALKRKAEAGDARSQMGLARMYYNGDGVTKNDVQAVEWYRKAAEQGNDFSQYKLGVMYANGEGVPKDATQAVEWLRKAAEQGNTAAQESLRQFPGK